MFIASQQPGQWRQSDLDQPLPFQVGDVLEIGPNSTVYQKRNGVVVGQATFVVGQPVSSFPASQAATISSLFFFQEIKMPGVIETLNSVQRDGDVLYFNFDGAQLEFPSIADALNVVGLLDTEAATARHMLILKTLRNSPDGANLETMVGGSCSLDFQAATPVVITPPPQ